MGLFSNIILHSRIDKCAVFLYCAKCYEHGFDVDIVLVYADAYVFILKFIVCGQL